MITHVCASVCVCALFYMCKIKCHHDEVMMICRYDGDTWVDVSCSVYKHTDIASPGLSALSHLALFFCSWSARRLRGDCLSQSERFCYKKLLLELYLCKVTHKQY